MPTKKNKKDILQAPKGMRDILPTEAVIWQKIEEKARDVSSYYGFMPIRTPHLEHTEIFTASLGETTDIIEKQMYSFKTRGRDTLTLRPEGTAPIMRAYLEHGMRSWPQPVKFYYHGSFFRHEKPQKGRFRELGQFGLETLGDETSVSDAMTIRVLTLILEEIGFKNFIVHINTLGDKECRGVYHKELVQFFRKKVNHICRDCRERLKKNPLRIMDCKNEECEKIKTEAPQIIEYVCVACKAHFKEVLEFLDDLKIPYFLNHQLVRGLDYYSRTVFEIFLDDKPLSSEKEEANHPLRVEDRLKVQSSAEVGDVSKEGEVINLPMKDDRLKEEKESKEVSMARNLALGGGGRYDYLSQSLSSKNISGTGGALGLDRIVDMAKELGIKIARNKQAKLFLIQLGIQAKRKSMSLVEEFRKANIPMAMSFGKDSIASQLKIADKIGANFALIMGQKEAFNEEVIIRDMESGIQETIPILGLLSYVKNKLKSR